MSLLYETIQSIQPIDKEIYKLAQQRQNNLTKPPGSLGRLETLSMQIAAITGLIRPEIRNKTVITCAGDHGVVAQGVSAFPQQVTQQMVINILQGGAAINVLARHCGAQVIVLDAGVAGDIDPLPGYINRKVAYGTADMTQGPAMTLQQASQAIEAGISAVQDELVQGLDIVATGDMGIGNTTPSSAIVACMTGKPVSEVTGRGTGIDDRQLENKIDVIQRALDINQPNPIDGLDVLQKVGGFEIGAIAGVILGAAANRIPVVIDGFISTASALIAGALAPLSKQYMIAAHVSVERGHQAALAHLGLTPCLDFDLRLGEGTGAALVISVAEAACKILNEMATFSSAGVSGAI
ncbi:MAG: nicotinate-nucleotide--dimethylbenzimidazole phosphoribosyltransferase [Anaerolineales bacterium]|nr:nicotinate-nucleotide--dimethylbenzimidazole phosphoribosyltransferase [Anaerolineales bacterium]